jgi:hypothetical protein
MGYPSRIFWARIASIEMPKASDQPESRVGAMRCDCPSQSQAAPTVAAPEIKTIDQTGQGLTNLIKNRLQGIA